MNWRRLSLCMAAAFVAGFTATVLALNAVATRALGRSPA